MDLCHPSVYLGAFNTSRQGHLACIPFAVIEVYDEESSNWWHGWFGAGVNPQGIWSCHVDNRPCMLCGDLRRVICTVSHHDGHGNMWNGHVNHQNRMLLLLLLYMYCNLHGTTEECRLFGRCMTRQIHNYLRYKVWSDIVILDTYRTGMPPTSLQSSWCLRRR